MTALRSTVVVLTAALSLTVVPVTVSSSLSGFLGGFLGAAAASTWSDTTSSSATLTTTTHRVAVAKSTVRTPRVSNRHMAVRARTIAVVPTALSRLNPSQTASTHQVTTVAPHAPIRITGSVKHRRSARVTLQRRAGNQKSYRSVKTVRTGSKSRSFVFATQMPKGSNTVTYRVRVTSAGARSYATVARFSQVAAPDALTVSTASPGIAATGNVTVPMAADAAGHLLSVAWTTGVDRRTIVLQQRRTGTRTWKDVESSPLLAARSRGDWSPRTAATSQNQYRAIFRYRTGVSTVSSTVTPQRATAFFSDEFSGSRLDMTRWAERREGNRCNFQSPGTSTVQVGGGVARLAPRIMAGSVPAVSCPGCVVPGSAGATDASQCVEVPHIMTLDRVAVPQEGEEVWMAARVKLQAGPDTDAQGGSHSAFWFNAGYCRGGEIDIFEYMGDRRVADGDHPDRRGAVAFKHYDLTTCDGHGQMQKRALTLLDRPDGEADTTWSQRYTIFALRWVQRGPTASYQLYVDGRHVTTVSARAVTTPDVGGMVLSNFVSDYENRGPASVRNSALHVDWVRAWRM